MDYNPRDPFGRMFGCWLAVMLILSAIISVGTIAIIVWFILFVIKQLGG